MIARGGGNVNTRDIISVTLYYLSEIKKDMEKHKINITQ